jgi:metallo-beta-lactamase family protein
MDDNACFLIDCGMYQGNRQIEQRNWQSGPYRSQELQAIFITHAHIDHSGLVPRLVREGYRGPVYATKATCELLRILWLDSAHIQEMEAEWQTRKNKRRGNKSLDPLYETADAEAAIGLLKPVEMDCHAEILPGVEVCFVGAGHILGAASVFLNLQGRGGPQRVGFSGDLGRPGQLIVPDPDTMPQPDTLFMETTYGNRSHKSLEDSQAELMEVIKQAYAEGGKVLIPAFAVERTQEIIYTLAEAHRQGEMPADMPVFLDSPLAIKATEIFRKHPEFFDQETTEILNQGQTPLNLPNLEFTLSTDESRSINEKGGPAVVIAGSGMASAGRIKHHLKHNIWRPNCHVVIVGFQAKGTTGRRLVEGARQVKIFREDVAVRAKVHTIGGFSAHADQGELLNWLETLAHPGLRVYLMHGEESASLAFKAKAESRLPGLHFAVPHWKDTLKLRAPKAPAKAKPRPSQEEVAARIVSLRQGLDQLAAKLEAAPEEVSGEELARLQKKLTAAERLLQAAGGA